MAGWPVNFRLRPEDRELARELLELLELDVLEVGTNHPEVYDRLRRWGHADMRVVGQGEHVVRLSSLGVAEARRRRTLQQRKDGRT